MLLLLGVLPTMFHALSWLQLQRTHECSLCNVNACTCTSVLTIFAVVAVVYKIMELTLTACAQNL